MGNCSSFKTTSTVTPHQKNLDITANCMTWLRDSHGLFDYENKNVLKKKLKINQSGHIIRDTQEIKYIRSIGSQQKLLTIVERGNDKVIQVDHKDWTDEHNVWLVVKSFKNMKNTKQYVLREGDLIKMGRMRFMVKEIVHHFQNQNINDDNNSQSSEQPNKSQYNQDQHQVEQSINKIINNQPNQQTEQDVVKDLNEVISNSEMCCRFCLFEEIDIINNPLVCACNCDGSMKYIHVECLQKWNYDKVNFKSTSNSKSYMWKALQCEICKHIYSDKISHNEQQFDIVKIDRPQNSPFILLKILSKDKDQSRGLHLVEFSVEKDQLKLGRGQDNDLRITDISVSRCHAMIKWEDGKFYIQDNESKFGTLILLKDQMVLDQTITNIQLQVGRTVIGFIIKKKWTAFNKQKKIVDNLSVINTEVNLEEKEQQKMKEIKNHYEPVNEEQSHEQIQMRRANID